MDSSAYTSGKGGYNLATTRDPLPPLPQIPGTDAAGASHAVGDIMDFAREMARRNAMARRSEMEDARARAAADRRIAASESYGPERTAQPARFETPWYSAQGAATRPVGLSAGMIPGMMADPRLLPPSMRPQNTEVARGGLTPDQYASATPEAQRALAEEEDRLRRQRESNQATAGDPYENIRRQNLNAGYGR